MYHNAADVKVGFEMQRNSAVLHGRPEFDITPF